jgi:hypothetical protein
VAAVTGTAAPRPRPRPPARPPSAPVAPARARDPRPPARPPRLAPVARVRPRVRPVPRPPPAPVTRARPRRLPAAPATGGGHAVITARSLRCAVKPRTPRLRADAGGGSRAHATGGERDHSAGPAVTVEIRHNAEILHPVEIKHLSRMRNFHVMQSFHDTASLEGCSRSLGERWDHGGLRAWRCAAAVLCDGYYRGNSALSGNSASSENKTPLRRAEFPCNTTSSASSACRAIRTTAAS